MARTSKNKAKNEAYIHSVTTGLRGLHRATLISVTTAMFREGLRMTWQDSGQAAYNWHMKAGNESMRPAMTRHMEGPVGARGENRSRNGREAEVIQAKLEEYSVGPEEYPATSGFLAEKVGDPSVRAAARVRKTSVYNPIYDFSSEEHKVHAARAFLQGRTRTVHEAMMAANQRQVEYLQAQVKQKRMGIPEFFSFLKKYLPSFSFAGKSL